MILDLFRIFLILLVPGLIGALSFSITARLKTEINIFVALILNLLTFATMITGLYYFRDYRIVDGSFFEYTSFNRQYILVSIIVAILWGVFSGLIRRLFFWIRR